MIETFLLSKLNQFLGDHEEAEIWFQQDGVTVHISRRLLDILRELFPGCLSLRGDITCPQGNSPDLSPCDIFLWKHWKAQLFKHCLTTLQTLKEAIIQALAVIPLEMTRRELWTIFWKDFVNVLLLDDGI
ncbi:DUF4817 domain-containing protein [Trichonephila clavipes]|nr:DUF4817 domain-containing protein [Trichonephila clavipes]